MSQSPQRGNEPIALIIDTSSSAVPGLDEARETAQKINLLIGSDQFKLFILGSPTPFSTATLRYAGSLGVNQQAQTCSLITPTMETLVREEHKHSVIIVGNGEVFDLDDWTDDPRIDGWLLVRTGKQSLQGTSGKVTEISVDQINWDDNDNIDTLFSYFSRFARKPEEPTGRDYYAGAHRWRIDDSGYPLIFVEPLGAFVHLFPVTKPQFEKFMSSDKEHDLGDEWYSQVLSLNPRVSYRSRDIQMRERLFMTGITTDEAVSFGRWLGRDYKLLSAEEWCICYEWFAGQSAVSTPLDLAKSLSRDALGVWDVVEGQWLDLDASLRELSLMTQGILEWVVERPGKYCALGEPASSRFQRKADDPVRPLGAEPRRLKNLGFRLCAR